MGFVGCTKSPQDRLDAATEQMYTGDFAGAQQTLRRLLKALDSQTPLDAAGKAAQRCALERVGNINALYLHDDAQAIADLGLLVRRYPQSEQAEAALWTIADIYQYRQGKLSEAIVTYERLVELFADSPKAPAAQLAIVQAYFRLKDYVQARQEARRIKQSWPKSPEASRAGFEIADAYSNERHFTEAIAAYEALLDEAPEPQLATLARFEMGNCYQELGEPQRALSAYYSALADHPNPALVQRKIARVRSRIYNLAPSEGILNAPPPSRRMLALQHRRMTRAPHKP
jgi:tetratricopeptide (TPR) repeat protein